MPLQTGAGIISACRAGDGGALMHAALVSRHADREIPTCASLARMAWCRAGISCHGTLEPQKNCRWPCAPAGQLPAAVISVFHDDRRRPGWENSTTHDDELRQAQPRDGAAARATTTGRTVAERLMSGAGRWSSPRSTKASACLCWKPPTSGTPVLLTSRNAGGGRQAGNYNDR